MKALLLAALAVFFSSAHAQPLPNLGDIIPGQKIVCDTEDQYRALWQVHKSQGAKAMIEATRAIQGVVNERGEPQCGVTAAPLMIVRIIESAWVKWSPGKTLWTHFVELRASNGRAAFAAVAMRNVEPADGA